MRSELIDVGTGSREVVFDLTSRCEQFVAAEAHQAQGDGLLHVFVPHATAGIAILETGAGSDTDLLAVLGELLPRDFRWQHKHGTAGHGRDHVVAGPDPAARLDPGDRRASHARDVAVDLSGGHQRRQPAPAGPALLAA